MPDAVRTPTRKSHDVGDPPKTKLPSGEKYRYFCPKIRVAFDGFVKLTTAAPPLMVYLTPVEVWVTTVAPPSPTYPEGETFPRLPAPSAFTWNIEPMAYRGPDAPTVYDRSISANQ